MRTITMVVSLTPKFAEQWADLNRFTVVRAKARGDGDSEVTVPLSQYPLVLRLWLAGTTVVRTL